MLRLHVYYLTFVSEVVGTLVEFSGDKAAKPVTTVQVCVSTFVCNTPLDIFFGGGGGTMAFQHDWIFFRRPFPPVFVAKNQKNIL